MSKPLRLPAIEVADGLPPIPGQLWIGIVGISERFQYFTEEEKAMYWLEANKNKARLWNVGLIDPVEMEIVPPTKIRMVPKGEGQ